MTPENDNSTMSAETEDEDILPSREIEQEVIDILDGAATTST
jgi:hypothetical protein